jgi:hypothetical protein
MSNAAWSGKNEEKLRKLAERAYDDPILFLNMAIVSEKTGLPILLERIQEKMIEKIMDPATKRLVVKASPEMGKTLIITVGLSIWLVGRKPDSHRNLIGSYKITQASMFLRSIRRYVDTSEFVKLVFPNLKAGDKWTESELEVARSPGAIVKDPSWAAGGADTSVTGKRNDMQIFDDIQVPENSQTEAQCDKVVDYIGECESRIDMDAKDAKRLFILNPQNEFDAGEKLVQFHGWDLFRLSCVDDSGKTTVPRIWTQARIDNYPEAIAQKHLWLNTAKKGDKVFQDAWVMRCLENGSNLTTVEKLDKDFEGVRIVTGVDLATRKTKTSDDTVIFTGMAAPASFFGIRGLMSDLPVIRPLYILRRKMIGPEIKQAIVDVWNRFGGTVVIEDVAAQKYLYDDLRLERSDIPVEPFTTTASRKGHEDYGVGGIAMEFSMGLWAIPCLTDRVTGVHRMEPEIELWVKGLRRFQKGGHTDDAVMASWFMREFIRRPTFTHSFGFVELGADHGSAPSGLFSRTAEPITVVAEQTEEQRTAEELRAAREADLEAEIKARFGL